MGRRPKQILLQRRNTDGYEARERRLTSLIIREMQKETKIRYYLTQVRMAIIKKSTNIKCWKGYGGNVNWYSHYGKQYGDSLKRQI